MAHSRFKQRRAARERQANTVNKPAPTAKQEVPKEFKRQIYAVLQTWREISNFSFSQNIEGFGEFYHNGKVVVVWNNNSPPSQPREVKVNNEWVAIQHVGCDSDEASQCGQVTTGYKDKGIPPQVSRVSSDRWR